VFNKWLNKKYMLQVTTDGTAVLHRYADSTPVPKQAPKAKRTFGHIRKLVSPSVDVNMAEGVSSDEDLETFLSKLVYNA